MNYTKLVREYCKNNSGAIFDASKLKDTKFAEVPYKTLLKILNPLSFGIEKLKRQKKSRSKMFSAL